MVERVRRYCPDKIGQTDRTMDRQTDTQTDGVIPIYPLYFSEVGGGGGRGEMGIIRV